MITIEEIFEYVKNKFDTVPDQPWPDTPEYLILRHQHGRKWYGAVMTVPGRRIGLDDKTVDIVNLKCDPDVVNSIIDNKRILPAYHMNKLHWITIVLASEITKDEVFDLINISHDLTKSKR